MIDYTLPLDRLPDPLPIEPLTKPFDVTITPPGSKSITCRAYVLAALAEGESQIIGPLRADDTDALLGALCTLGAEARWDGDNVRINGVGGRFPRGGHVNLGDGGAPTRFMIAAACLAAEPVVVDASPRMRQRPIAEGIDMLRQLGAKIEYAEQEGRLPVRVVPSKDFVGGELEIGTTTSSQFVSALMLIAPFTERGVVLTYAQDPTSASYIELSRCVLGDWGIKHLAIRRFWRFGRVIADRIDSRPPNRQEYTVEADASSAAYWLTAVAINLHTHMEIRGLGHPWSRSQPDIKFCLTVQNAGMYMEPWPWGIDAANLGVLKCPDCDAAGLPDASLAVAILAACSETSSTVTGLHTLRHKETDRIAALANELRRIGCTVETTDDSITIDPSTRHDEPVVIETYNDHRMAMAFAVLGLARPGISIKNPACVSKSYPTFWKDFAKLYQ
ncbi:MAG: 3-phosphoshikimate 1-carboxyvinyltransferase [Planctomycetes bacterium]|nr:3-phosphoshikimate 1-carboxyvinyltransferase [Planctomycetota bacterium]